MRCAIQCSKLRILTCAVLVLAAIPAFAGGGDWIGFRGPGTAGMGEATGLPVTWDSKENIVWSTELPGLGASSPLVMNGRIYVTAYSGYAESIEDPGNQEDLMRYVVCLDRASGKIIWTKQFKPKLPESDYKSANNTRHGYASSTITSDGEKLFVFFGISGFFALDLEGNILWQTDLGSGTHGWGSATSPVLWNNLVIVNASVESQSLYGLNKDTGKVVWKTEGTKGSWSSPVLADADGKQEVVISLPKKLAAYDPATGKELWFCEGIPDGYVCPAALIHDGVAYVLGGRKNTAIAVRVGGRGDVNATHVLWRAEKGSNVTSPCYVDGYLYWMHESRGVAYCLNAKTGEVVYEAELDPKPGLLYGSATYADGRFYSPSQDNGTYVVAAKPEFELLAINKFQDDPSRVNASIAVSNNQLIMRTDKAIYCIGK